MNNTHILTCCIAVLLSSSGSPFCASNVCFNWTLYDDALELRCLITDLKHRVFIFDPNRKVQADCLPVFPPDCSAYFRNGTTYFDGSTNEIVFTLRGDISQNIEGRWVCEHGKYRDAAYADVNYDLTKELISRTTEAEKTEVTTSKRVLTSFLIETYSFTKEETSKHTTSSTTCTGSTHGNKKDTTYHGKQLWRYMGPMIGIGIFCVFLFVCNFLVNYKHATFTPGNISNEINTNSQHPSFQTTTENNVGQEIHNYEIIDEIELFENSVSQIFNQQNTISEGNDVSPPHSSTSTPSGHSYFEVIDNPQIDSSEYLEPSNYTDPQYLMISIEQVGTISDSQSANYEVIQNLNLDIIDALADNARYSSDSKRLSKSSLDGEDNIQLHDQYNGALSSSPEWSDTDHQSPTQNRSNMFSEVL